MKYFTFLLTLLLLSGYSSYGQELGSMLVESPEIKSLKKDKVFNVKISTLIFRKVDSRHRIVEFTADDAHIISNYIMGRKGVLSCKSNSLDKTFKIVSKADVDGEGAFSHKEVVMEMAKVGYMATTSRSYEDVVMFASNGNCMHRNVKDGLILTTRDRMQSDDCNDCGEVEVSEETKEKYKNMDYGGEEMDFGFEEPSTEMPVVEEETVNKEEKQDNNQLEFIEVKASSKEDKGQLIKVSDEEELDEEELEYQNPTLNSAPR